jgi:transposase-like protein
MLHHDFPRFIDALDELNPAQIKDAQTKIRDLRRKTEAISEIEAGTNREHKCPFCGDDQRQKWGRTRTKVQRYRCSGCKKTYSGRTGSAIGRIHRPDLFMVDLWDMLGTSVPQIVRALAHQLRLNKYAVWRWRMLVFSIIGSGKAMGFSGIIEADETYQRESRKGSREWVGHFADPQNVSPPPRPRWEDFTTQGLKTMRGPLEVAAAHSHVCRPRRCTAFPQTAEPQGRDGGTRYEPLSSRRCRALLGWRQRLQEPSGGTLP